MRPFPQVDLPSDPRRRAGLEAERQLAHYLSREFATDPSVLVLHDLRLVDPEQPEHNGSPGVAQMDCLIVHRLGMFIVESKSVAGSLTVRPDGQGSDQWTRSGVGMPSPIQQAERQAAFLRAFLQRHRADLLGKVMVGMRTVMKVIAGTDQRGFTNMPIQIVVAISDKGRIDTKGGWKPPTEPFRTFLCKADTVTTHVRTELATHRASAPLLSKPQGQYGDWSMTEDEAKTVAQFLLENHTPLRAETPQRSPAPLQVPAASPAQARAQPQPAASAPSAPTCKHCHSANLSAHWGQHGYYWKCGDCSKNTAMPTVCSVCGAKGDRGKGVRIRKDGPAYYRGCEACGISERVC